MRAPDDEGDQVGGAQKNRAKYQLDRLQESHDALKQRCDVLLLGLLVLTLLVVWSNYCTQTFFTNEYGRDAFCIFMALCFILSSENKESITALSKPKRYFLIFFGFMLLSMGQSAALVAPQLAAPAAWGARLRVWAALRTLGECLDRSDLGGSIWGCCQPVLQSLI